MEERKGKGRCDERMISSWSVKNQGCSHFKMSTDCAGESAPNSKRELVDHELNVMENVQRVIQALREKYVTS